MATERLLMRHIREILRLKWTLRRSHRDTARSLGISAGAVASVVTRAKAMALTWDAVSALSDDALERTLYGPTLALTVARPGPDLVWMHTELRRPGVTLELLHLEYLTAHPDGYRYSAFCGHYRRWLAQQRTSMRQVHTAGEKTFVDYAGQRPSLVDPATGEVVPVELFVAVLGASNYTYAEATLRSAASISSRATRVPSSTGAASPRWWCRINSGPAWSPRAGMSRRSNGRMRTGRGTMGRRSSPPDPRSPATRRRSKSRSRSPNAGFWRGCGTRPSSRWPR